MKPPKRYKRFSFWLCVVLAAASLLTLCNKLTAVNIYEREGWLPCLLTTAVLITAAVLLFLRNRASDRAWEQYEADRVETERLLREKLQAEQDEKKARQQEFDRTHGRIFTRLACVTFDNDDGSSRQRVLKAALAEDCAGSVSLELYEYRGEDAILVEYEGRGVGNIPRDRVAEVAAVMDRITAGSLLVNRFVPCDEDEETTRAGGVIYRADLTLVYTK